MVSAISGAGLVGFLEEPDFDLQAFALQTANQSIGLLWTELAGAIGQIEAIYEDESFPQRDLAALVASKIYYHLQEYDESAIFALGAGKLFDINQEGEFEDTIIAKCIDTYITVSTERDVATSKYSSKKVSSELNNAFSNANGMAGGSTLTSPTAPFSKSALPSKSFLSRESNSSEDSPKSVGLASVHQGLLAPATQKALHEIIRRIFEKCYQKGAYHQVVGIAVEARNLDILRETITRASEHSVDDGKPTPQDKTGGHEEIMDYLLDICLNVVQERVLRNEILQLILDLLLLNRVTSPDYFSIAKCMVYLGQHTMASDMLCQLVEQGDTKALAVAYQISFDLYDNGTQEFLNKVMDGLPATEETKSEFAPALNGNAIAANVSPTTQDSEQLLSELEDRAGAPATSTVVSRTKPGSSTEQHRKAYALIGSILLGAKSIELGLEFLFRANKSDHSILTKLKSSLEARNSIFHSAVTFANAFMNAGTTSDWFIRENLDWLGKAVNWSKFSVTASLGVLHRGNIGQGRKLLEPYLRDSGPQGAGSAYSKGGALYALGLIYTNHGKHVLEYLHKQLQNAQSEEIVQHGAALGVGVAGMATESEDVVYELKQALYSDSAISGQTAGLAIGLVMLGSGNIKALLDMIAYAHETQHDKTVRGLALGMALIMYGRQEAADELITGLLDDPDPTLRFGGTWTIALAYCGTSSNHAVRKLLHVAVSDVNDDVRRTAVMGLGFVLFRKPGSVPRMVELLAESYNPHVRYGAAMALGIACAGTGLEEAVDLLEPMMKDTTDFVRQGAFIALSMILIQQTEAMNPKVVAIRKHLQKAISDRHEDAMSKFGAALALGIIDAGGRNCTISLQTQTGNLNMSAIVGIAIFTQYWYWFPLTHFASLAFTPTSVIAVDQDLEIPDLKLHCNSRPSLFEYPPAMEVKTEEAPEKVKAAVLSTTAQAKRRKAARDRQTKGDSMDVDQASTTPKTMGSDDDKMETDEDVAKEDDKDGKVENDAQQTPKTIKAKLDKEKVGFELDNLSRVLPAQLKHISFVEGRYSPVKKPSGGVVLVVDDEPSEPKSLVERQVKKASPRPAPDAAAPQTPLANIQRHEEPQRQADDAAAVLMAVDEDDDAGEEAQVPEAFEYYSDGEGADE